MNVFLPKVLPQFISWAMRTNMSLGFLLCTSVTWYTFLEPSNIPGIFPGDQLSLSNEQIRCREERSGSYWLSSLSRYFQLYDMSRWGVVVPLVDFRASARDIIPADSLGSFTIVNRHVGYWIWKTSCLSTYLRMDDILLWGDLIPLYVLPPGVATASPAGRMWGKTDICWTATGTW